MCVLVREMLLLVVLRGKCTQSNLSKLVEDTKRESVSVHFEPENSLCRKPEKSLKSQLCAHVLLILC